MRIISILVYFAELFGLKGLFCVIILCAGALHIGLAYGLKTYVGNWAMSMYLTGTTVLGLKWFMMHGYQVLGFGPEPFTISLKISEDPADRVRFVCISDTHSTHRKVTIPDGDVLICTGDFTRHGERETVEDFNSWLKTLPHKHKLLVYGNHDLSMDEEFLKHNRDTWDKYNKGQDPEGITKLITEAKILDGELVEIEGMKIYGLNIMSHGIGLCACARDRETLMKEYAKIPPSLDVLLTHQPPWGLGDTTFLGSLVGCPLLRQEVEKKRPAFHVFGHIHEGYGVYFHPYGGIFINCATTNILSQASHKPVVFDIQKKR